MTGGTVVAAHGRQFLVDTGGAIVECVTRGKKGGVACGDAVEIQSTGPGKGVIEATRERRNLLYRSDEFKTKLIAANLDQAVIVVAAVPAFREELLIRCIVACEAEDIPVLLLLNKADLVQTQALAQTVAAYVELGYPFLQVSALGDLAALEQRLAGRTSILVGGSGVGKSTLLNRLVPGARAVTGEISLALDAGRHTTTHTRLYRLPGGGDLLDSPGMQEFGLKHLNQDRLMAAFPEIRTRLGQCRFYNCRHLREPGCAVLNAAEAGEIRASRLRVYHALLLGLDAPAY